MSHVIDAPWRVVASRNVRADAHSHRLNATVSKALFPLLGPIALLWALPSVEALRPVPPELRSSLSSGAALSDRHGALNRRLDILTNGMVDDSAVDDFAPCTEDDPCYAFAGVEEMVLTDTDEDRVCRSVESLSLLRHYGGTFSAYPNQGHLVTKANASCSVRHRRRRHPAGRGGGGRQVASSAPCRRARGVILDENDDGTYNVEHAQWDEGSRLQEDVEESEMRRVEDKKIRSD